MLRLNSVVLDRGDILTRHTYCYVPLKQRMRESFGLTLELELAPAAAEPVAAVVVGRGGGRGGAASAARRRERIAVRRARVLARDEEVTREHAERRRRAGGERREVGALAYGVVARRRIAVPL